MIEALTFEQQNNADWTQQLQLNSYNASTNQRTPFNLSGVEAKLLLVGASSAHPSLLLSTVNSLLIIPSSGDLGEMIIQVPAARMWTLTGGIYTGDCLLFLPSGAVTLAFTAQLTVYAGVTPPTP
jgi:hypothetical protein